MFIYRGKSTRRDEAHLWISHALTRGQLHRKVIDVPANPPSRDNQDVKLAELHKRLTASVEALVTGDEWRRALEFATRFRARSFNNTILIWSQHAAAFERGFVAAPSPSYVAGFRQWLTLDRRVVAGQKGYMILAPVTARFASSAPSDQGSWRRLDRSERPRAGEVVRARMVGTRPAYVWDVSQTDGAPIPERPAPTLLMGEAPAGLLDCLASLIRDARYFLSEAPDAAALGGANGVTNFESHTVSVRADMDAAARAKTLVHELAHIRMHEANSDTRLHRGVAEVEAESVALMVGAAHGMDTSEYTIPYVSTWAASVADKTVAEVIQATGERVRRAAVSILDQLPTARMGDGDLFGFDRSNPTRTPAAAGVAPERSAERPEVRSL
ncbi:ArdC family protein [Conyzicola sp.]|uniref:ArdC family protein n=1 Tax=Conyzicola sp. TaxID=1969404 RepID=UPI00398A1A74